MTTELESARLVRAALRIVRDSFSDYGALDATVSRWQSELENVIEGLENTGIEVPAIPMPVEIRWADVVPGDKVIAPNGVIYTVDDTARTDAVVKVLLIHPNSPGDMVVTTRNASDKVLTERGNTGKAIDMFTAAGMTLEAIR